MRKGRHNQCDSRRNADGIYQAKGRRKQVSVADLEDLALLVSHHQAYKAAAKHYTLKSELDLPAKALPCSAAALYA